jgi:hypothetical protein
VVVEEEVAVVVAVAEDQHLEIGRSAPQTPSAVTVAAAIVTQTMEG